MKRCKNIAPSSTFEQKSRQQIDFLTNQGILLLGALFKVVAQRRKVIVPKAMVWNLICYELVVELQGQICYKIILDRSPSTQFRPYPNT